MQTSEPAFFEAHCMCYAKSGSLSMSEKKILCLHGAGTSDDILRSQLGSIAPTLEKDLSVTLVYVNAPIDCGPHKAVDGIYEGPFKTWFTWSGQNPPPESDVESILDSFDLLYQIIEEQGPFEGVIGFSQGATIAAAILLHYQRQNPLEPAYALFKYAIFFSAAAIVDIEPIPLLKDWAENRKIHIPTLHVLGKEDPLYSEGIAMSKICSGDLTSVVTHNQGHCIPRDAGTVRAIVKAMEMLHFMSVVA
ncbi:hypothetical protein EJ08DRAFT_43567 [Tothia fuscella]|uniref:Serine hydrolase domain-containing protein n=1 Tax=Tothia fuscella TaxID=1048955 RepID=A0A9P4NFN4_9PEZI|nr:hypothetical protein EJ08DRAFT_43567 [Tothia fuscella]